MVRSSDYYFGHVDDDVTGRVDDEHQVVPPGETVRPAAPVLDGPVGQHLGARSCQKCLL